MTVNAAAVAGPLSVTPAGGLTSAGTVGGPFTPSSQAFTLSNPGSAPMNWTAGKTQSWVTLSSTGGTLAAGATTTVTASVNSGANSLAAGSYSDTVTFGNATNGTGNTTRAVSLTVNAASVAGPNVSVMPAAGSVDVPVNSVISATLTGTGDIASIFNAQTFRLMVMGTEPPDSSCVDDGFVKGAISYNASPTRRERSPRPAPSRPARPMRRRSPPWRADSPRRKKRGAGEVSATFVVR